MRMAWQETRQMQAQRRPKTVYNCLTALRALQRFIDASHPGMKGRLPVRCLTSYLMRDFHDWLLSRGVSENSIREYLRSLRSIVNRCARHRLPLRGDLFGRVSTSVLPSTKQPIGQHDMRRIHEAGVRPGSTDELVRDCAVFSYLSGGMAFADLSRLRDCDYDAGSNLLSYRRHKTGVPVSFHLPPKARWIWEKYALHGSRPFHFALMRSATSADVSEKDYANALAVYNRRLRRIASGCGVTTAVTSYVLRRTFATVARNDYHAQVNVISVPLGHRSERTTAIYLSRPDCSTVSSLLNKLDKGLQRKSH